MNTSATPGCLLDLPAGNLRAELVRWLQERSQPAWRADQVIDWVFLKRELDPGSMTNLPPALRSDLLEGLPPGRLELAEENRSADGTIKYLWRRPEGGTFESVRIPTPRRITLCVSSQVGCALACQFCATGYMGFESNLRPGEIVEQVLRMLRGEPQTRSVNIVFMGMGEPFLNTQSVFEAARTLNELAEIGARRITVSTVGIVPGIEAMADLPLQLRLAVSLHAATDELRTQLMPINARWPLAQLVGACRRYTDRTGRRISFEYIQLAGLNDTPGMVNALRDLLGDLPAKINLIPYNAVEGADFRVPTDAEVERFAGRLQSALVQGVSIRRNRGNDVTAACGQLRTVVDRRTRSGAASNRP